MARILLWVLGVAGVVCWVIKLPGCEAAGSSLLLCSAPGLKWYSSVQVITVVESIRKGSLAQADRVANGGERRVYWLLPGISPAGILQRILPGADYCRAFWEVSILPPPARDSVPPCRSNWWQLRSKEPLFISNTSWAKLCSSSRSYGTGSVFALEPPKARKMRLTTNSR